MKFPMIAASCDYCGQGGHRVRFDGGGYCSCECASAAEMARRREGNELRDRQAASRRSYQSTREALLVGLIVLVVALICFSGCDAPGDHIGPDERSHLAAGHTIGGIE